MLPAVASLGNSDSAAGKLISHSQISHTLLHQCPQCFSAPYRQCPAAFTLDHRHCCVTGQRSEPAPSSRLFDRPTPSTRSSVLTCALLGRPLCRITLSGAVRNSSTSEVVSPSVLSRDSAATHCRVAVSMLLVSVLLDVKPAPVPTCPVSGGAVRNSSASEVVLSCVNKRSFATPQMCTPPVSTGYIPIEYIMSCMSDHNQTPNDCAPTVDPVSAQSRQRACEPCWHAVATAVST